MPRPIRFINHYPMVLLLAIAMFFSTLSIFSSSATAEEVRGLWNKAQSRGSTVIFDAHANGRTAEAAVTSDYPRYTNPRVSSVTKAYDSRGRLLWTVDVRDLKRNGITNLTYNRDRQRHIRGTIMQMCVTWHLRAAADHSACVKNKV